MIWIDLLKVTADKGTLPRGFALSAQEAAGKLHVCQQAADIELCVLLGCDLVEEGEVPTLWAVNRGAYVRLCEVRLAPLKDMLPPGLASAAEEAELVPVPAILAEGWPGVEAFLGLHGFSGPAL